jgi:hypothetical protein
MMLVLRIRNRSVEVVWGGTFTRQFSKYLRSLSSNSNTATLPLRTLEIPRKDGIKLLPYRKLSSAQRW